MTGTLSIPLEGIPYLLWQRTEYQFLPLRLLRALVPNAWTEEWDTQVIGSFKKRSVEKRFTQDLSREFSVIQNYLPSRANSILDIGCGIGGINVFLNRHYQAQKPMFFLLDRDGVSPKVSYGMKQNACFYHSFKLTTHFLTANGLETNQIKTIDISREKFPLKERFSLITSFISYGFHYPIDTYLNEVYETLLDDGKLILDIRVGTDGIDKLKTKFSRITTIHQDNKAHRVAVQK